MDEKTAKEIQTEFTGRMRTVLTEQVNRTLMTEVMATGLGSVLNSQLAHVLGSRIVEPKEPDDNDTFDDIVEGGNEGA